MSASFSYNSTNGQPTAAPANGFYHVPTSGFQFHQYPPSVVQNGPLTSTAAPTAFTNVISTRGYHPQQLTHGTMQNQASQYQLPDSRLANNDDEDDLQSLDSVSEGRTPTQSDQQISGPLQTRKRRRGVIEKRRRDRINSSLAELRRLVPAAFEKQGSQKLEKAEILQMTVDHLRFLNSKGFDALWRDQQRYATEYYSMGFRVCISEVDTFLSKEGMDMQDPLRLRLMSHLQCVGVQRQSAFNVWTATAHQNSRPYQHAQTQPSYWPPTVAAAAASPASSAAAGLQYAVYGVIPPAADVVYPSQGLATVPTSSTGQHLHYDGATMFKNGFVNPTQAQVPPTPFSNGSMTHFAASTAASSSASSMNDVASASGSGY